MAGRFTTRAAMLLLAIGALSGAQAALAQTIDCARLPVEERDAARRAGRCVDSAAAPARIDPRILAAQAGLPVPKLTDAPLNRSDERIARFQLQTDYRPGVQPRDWVLEQQPPAGSRLRAGGTLVLTLSDGSRVLVPNVVTLDADAARERLRRVTLGARVESVTGAPAGRVISQEPAPGTEVTRRSVVALRVTSGAPPPPPPDKTGEAVEIPVPDVVGLAYDDAIARLARFRPDRSHRAATEPGGRVIAQNPPPGTLRPPGSTVAIVLSDGTLTVVPDLRGLPFERATQQLAQAALRAQRIDSTSDQLAGQVIGQAPIGGDRVARGTVVRVQVSSGPAALEVPNVVGLRVDDARARLGPFTVTRTDAAASEPRDQVIAQRPAAGTRIPRGGAVAVTVSTGQELIEVPNVVETDVASARTRLSEFRVTSIEVPGRPPSGRVVAQAPPAGTLHPPGGPVTLSVTDGSLIEVPPPDPPKAAADPTAPLRWWLIAGGFGVLMLGAGVLVGRIGAPKPVPHITAGGSLEPSHADVRVDGATPIGPALEFKSELERGDPTVEPDPPEVS